jgi:hypothetical protein
MSTPIDTLFLSPPDIPLFSSSPTKLFESDGQQWTTTGDGLFAGIQTLREITCRMGGLQMGKKGKKGK